MDSLIARSRQFRTRVGPSMMVRVGLAVCAMALWALAALVPIVAPLFASHGAGASANASSPSALVPQATALPASAQSSATFYQVLEIAGKSCPTGRTIPILTDYSPAYNLGNYYLYPRKLTPVGSGDSFDSAALNGYRGGCLLAYDQQSMKRATLFSSRLQEITCSFDGCLYSVK